MASIDGKVDDRRRQDERFPHRFIWWTFFYSTVFALLILAFAVLLNVAADLFV